MKFRRLKRKREAANEKTTAKPPQVITVNVQDKLCEEDRNERKWALQKVFASHLAIISRKHLDDTRQVIRRRSSLVDASTASDSSPLRPTDQAEEPAAQPRAPYFRITCGRNSSIVQHARQSEEKPLDTSENVEKNSTCWVTDPIGCSGRHAHNTKQNHIRQKPLCQNYGSCCLMAFFPDSYSSDLRVVDENNPNDGKVSPAGKLGSLFLFTNALRKKTETKRNGIPKVITVVTQVPAKKRLEKSCCGTNSFYNQGSEIYTVYNPVSFDSSILRLEQELMRANLDADIERKVEHPTHEPLPPDTNHPERTATAASVTSSISTRSSLKFSASIVKLPPAMEMLRAVAEAE
jgi:hypothetical protein